MTRWSRTRLACVPAALLWLLGCTATKAPPSALAAEVDAACGGAAWRDRHALSADVTVSRKGCRDMRGRLLYDIGFNRLVVEFPAPGGGVASCGFDGHSVWVDCPSDSGCADWPAILQWAAWVSVPYRLTDPSIRVREVQPISVAGATYRVAELRRPAVGRGVCALYVDQSDFRPRGAVPVCPAGAAPDDIPGGYGFAYEEFGVCDNVPVPMRWSVWPWQARTGISAAGPVASISLENPRFVYPDPTLFDAPRNGSTKPPAGTVSPARPRHLEEASLGNP